MKYPKRHRIYLLVKVYRDTNEQHQNVTKGKVKDEIVVDFTCGFLCLDNQKYQNVPDTTHDKNNDVEYQLCNRDNLQGVLLVCRPIHAWNFMICATDISLLQAENEIIQNRIIRIRNSIPRSSQNNKCSGLSFKNL